MEKYFRLLSVCAMMEIGSTVMDAQILAKSKNFTPAITVKALQSASIKEIH